VGCKVPCRENYRKAEGLTPIFVSWVGWSQITDHFHEIIASGEVRRGITVLPLLDMNRLVQGKRERRRALLIYSQLCSAWVWGGGSDVTPLDHIPPRM